MNTTKLLQGNRDLIARKPYLQGLSVFSHSLNYPNF